MPLGELLAVGTGDLLARSPGPYERSGQKRTLMLAHSPGAGSADPQRPCCSVIVTPLAFLCVVDALLFNGYLACAPASRLGEGTWT